LQVPQCCTPFPVEIGCQLQQHEPAHGHARPGASATGPTVPPPSTIKQSQIASGGPSHDRRRPSAIARPESRVAARMEKSGDRLLVLCW
jgi:hypothetical protein